MTPAAYFEQQQHTLTLPTVSSVTYVLRFLEKLCHNLHCDALFGSQPVARGGLHYEGHAHTPGNSHAHTPSNSHAHTPSNSHTPYVLATPTCRVIATSPICISHAHMQGNSHAHFRY